MDTPATPPAKNTILNITDLKAQFNGKVAKTTKDLLQMKGISDGHLAALAKERFGAIIDASNISKIWRDPDGKGLSPVLIYLACDALGVSFMDIVNMAYSDKGKSSLTINSNSNDNTLLMLPAGPHFTFNADDSKFKGMLGKFHTYFISTVSSESSKAKIITGKINFYKDNLSIKASLTLNASSRNSKEYAGILFYSQKFDMFHCMLFSATLGEFCALSFQPYSTNFTQIECRMAAVLTPCVRTHRPTVQRMFLSRDPIKPRHYPLLTPSLRLNDSIIFVSAKHFDELKKNPAYASIIDRVLAASAKEPAPYYMFPEKLVNEVALHTSGDRATSYKFLMDIRSSAVSAPYNKIRENSIIGLRDALCEVGYYRRRRKKVSHDV